MNSCSQMQSFLSTVEEHTKKYAENYFSEKFHAYAQALGQHFECSVDDIMQICEQAEPMANVSKEEKELKSLTLSEVKAKCKQLGIKTSNLRKNVLIQKILNNDHALTSSVASAPDDADRNARQENWTVLQLKKFCKDKNIQGYKSNMKKTALIALVEEYKSSPLDNNDESSVTEDNNNNESSVTEDNNNESPKVQYTDDLIQPQSFEENYPSSPVSTEDDRLLSDHTNNGLSTTMGHANIASKIKPIISFDNNEEINCVSVCKGLGNLTDNECREKVSVLLHRQDYHGMQTAQLLKICHHRGIETTGCRSNEIIKKLEEYDSNLLHEKFQLEMENVL